MTDNGAAHRTRPFAATLEQSRIPHAFTQPYTLRLP